MYENDVNEDDSDYDKMIQNKVIDSLPSSHRKSPNNYTFEKLHVGKAYATSLGHI